MQTGREMDLGYGRTNKCKNLKTLHMEEIQGYLLSECDSQFKSNKDPCLFTV